MMGVIHRVAQAPRWFVLCLIQFYRSCISPRYPSCCRYVPSCSQYAVTAIERFGLVRGGWMALRRIARCHPLHEGGYDPVPETLPRRQGLWARHGHGRLGVSSSMRFTSPRHD